jgi:hypothetical protein
VRFLRRRGQKKFRLLSAMRTFAGGADGFDGKLESFVAVRAFSLQIFAGGHGLFHSRRRF